ncbi:MAG: trypsin-like serine protease, partial [Planctomycetota bacterium]
MSAATRVVEYDLIAGTQEVLDEGVRINADDSAALDASLRAEGFEGGLDALLASFGSPDDFTDMVDSLLAGDVHTGMSPTGDRVDFNDPTLYDVKDFDRSVSGADNRVRVTDTTQFPFSAVGRLATGCSGAMIGPYHFLTAGHCVLDFAGNPDPLSSLGVSLGRDGADRPFGEAEATFVRTYSEFAQGNQWEHDWAVITLDRSIGNYAGYFGYRHYEGNDALAGKPVTILQYPGDKPTGTQWRADGVIASQAQVNAWRTGSDYSTELKTFYNGTLDTAGGSSGSSVWEQLPGDEVPQVLAVHGYGFPSSQPNGFNSASRLDTRKITDIGLWKLADDAARPPVDFADLTVSATGSELTLPVGGQFTLSGAIRNTGTAIASDVEYSVYASTDDILGNSDDILLAQGTLDEVVPYAADQSAGIIGRLPSGMADGLYSVGYVVDAGDAIDEISETNNSAFA